MHHNIGPTRRQRLSAQDLLVSPFLTEEEKKYIISCLIYCPECENMVFFLIWGEILNTGVCMSDPSAGLMIYL